MPQSDAEYQLPFSAGVICCYSLKNVAHPEYVFVTESGVMCLDFHPQVLKFCFLCEFTNFTLASITYGGGLIRW